MQEVILENENLKVELLPRGASIYRLVEKTTGTDIVLGCENKADYQDNRDCYFGATIGPVANRIKNAQYQLFGHKYQLTPNNNGNNNHSYNQEISNKEFVLMRSLNTARFSYEDEYASYHVIYQLQANTLVINFEVKAKTDCLLNLTNHSYFNLNGKGTILNHELEIPSIGYYPLDESGCATGELMALDKELDYNKGKKINLDFTNPQIAQAKGIDHPFALKDNHLIKLRGDQLELQVQTTYPVVVVYSGNYLEGVVGKNQVYQDYSGICLECQYPVSDITYNCDHSQTIFKKGDTLKETISFKVIKYA